MMDGDDGQGIGSTHKAVDGLKTVSEQVTEVARRYRL